MKNKLKKIIKDNKLDNPLKSYVADYILDEMSEYNGTEKEQITSWLNDLFRGGCQSGFIGGLIYYKDTHAFYDKYYDDIEELRIEAMANGGLDMGDSDLKNWLAWFGFEETALKIADELGIEI